MAITRRQFVTRMGALAAAVGFSQANVSQLSGAFAQSGFAWGGTVDKPKVVWVHGAECTGCSTSLLAILESPNGHPIYGDKSTTTLAALGLAKVGPVGSIAGATHNPFSLWTDTTNAIEGAPLVNIADVVIDVIDLQYHETVMGMGGDLAAQWLNDFVTNPGAAPFVLVVEGALQDRTGGGAWSDASTDNIVDFPAGPLPWCSVGCSDNFDASTDTGFENDMATTVVALAEKAGCAAIIPIGQCACFGGYPGCKPPITAAEAAGFTPTSSQTGAMGVGDYLSYVNTVDSLAAKAKVINVPGCPTNPWWFVLTVVMFMVDFIADGSALHILDPGTKLPLPSAVDSEGRLKNVYPIPVHSGWCPRYQYYTKGVYALHPGDTGCLQKLGCKGIATKSLCGIHGWNNQQPENGIYSNCDATLGLGGGHCTKAGHPCMACTEKGYPDSFVPYVRL